MNLDYNKLADLSSPPPVPLYKNHEDAYLETIENTNVMLWKYDEDIYPDFASAEAVYAQDTRKNIDPPKEEWAIGKIYRVHDPLRNTSYDYIGGLLADFKVSRINNDNMFLYSTLIEYMGAKKNHRHSPNVDIVHIEDFIPGQYLIRNFHPDDLFTILFKLESFTSYDGWRRYLESKSNPKVSLFPSDDFNQSRADAANEYVSEMYKLLTREGEDLTLNLASSLVDIEDTVAPFAEELIARYTKR